MLLKAPVLRDRGHGPVEVHPILKAVIWVIQDIGEDNRCIRTHFKLKTLK